MSIIQRCLACSFFLALFIFFGLVAPTRNVAANVFKPEFPFAIRSNADGLQLTARANRSAALALAVRLDPVTGELLLMDLTSGALLRRPAAAVGTQLSVLLADEDYLVFDLDPTASDFVLEHDRRGATIVRAAGDLTLTDAHLSGSLSVTTAGRLSVNGPLQIETRFSSWSEQLRLGEAGVIAVSHGSATLIAEDQLVLQAGRVQTAGDLHLAAATIRLRDDSHHPMKLEAGGQLLMQGDVRIDIDALSHADSYLLSGGDMLLRSENTVRGDVHYLSGGQFRIERLDGSRADLFSPHDPIILASGDVSLGDYIGASLHILAGGRVTLDNVEITATDSTANTVNSLNAATFNGSDTIASLATFNLSDGRSFVVNGQSRPTLDVRAGIDWAAFPGGAPANHVIPANAVTPTFGPGSSSADIEILGDIRVSAPNGTVLLTNQFQPNIALTGDVVAGNIDTSTATGNSNGGSITIDSRREISAGNLNSYAAPAGASAGAGGSILLLAPNGNIGTGDLRAYSIASDIHDAGNGGAITVAAGNQITITSHVFSQSTNSGANGGDAGDGGDIVLMAGNGINLAGGVGYLNSYSWSGSGNAGSGGAITMTTSSGNLTVGHAHAFTYAPSGDAQHGGSIDLSTANGAIHVLSAASSYSFGSFAWGYGTVGNGGSIHLAATEGIIVTLSARSYAFVNSNGNGTAGNAGDIQYSTSSGNIVSAFLDAAVTADKVGGNGGTITLYAPDGDVETGFLESDVTADTAGRGGDVTVTAGGDVIAGTVRTYSHGDVAAGGGHIRFTAGGNMTIGTTLYSYVLANVGAAGNAGDVVLDAGGTLNSLSVINTSVRSVTGSGNGGDITIDAAGPLSVGSLDAFTRFSGNGYSGNGGEINVTARNVASLNGDDDLAINRIFSDSGTWYNSGAVGPSGNGGNINVTTEDGGVNVSNWIWNMSQSRGGANNSGDGGDVAVIASGGDIQIGPYGINSQSWVTSGSTGDSGHGGNVTLVASGRIAVNVTAPNGGINTISVATAGSSAGGGDVYLEASGGDISLGSNNIYTFARSTSAVANDGGAIVLAGSANVYAHNLDSSSLSSAGSAAGNGGPVTISAGANVALGGRIFTYTSGQNGTSGNGGDATIDAGGTLNLIDITSYTRSQSGTGNAGDITISADGPLTLNNVLSDARFTGDGYSGDGGDVTITARNEGPMDGSDSLTIDRVWVDSGAWYSTLAIGSAGNGGNISLTAEDGDVVVTEWLWNMTAARGGAVSTGEGGDTSITAANGTITIGNYGVNSGAHILSGDGDAGAGGNVNLTASGNINVNVSNTNGGIQTRSTTPSGSTALAGTVSLQTTGGSIDLGGNSIQAYTSSLNGSSGDGGMVMLTAAGDITLRAIDTGSRGSGGDGQGGIVNVQSDQFVRLTGVASSTDSITTAGGAGGGVITITHGGNGVTPFTVGDATINGTAGNLNSGEATLLAVQPYLYNHFEAPNIWLVSVPSPLTIAKFAAETENVPYGGELQYTILLTNSLATPGDNVWLTDTLPANVAFAYWVDQPLGAAVVDGELQWNGSVPAEGFVSFSYVVNHTGDYGEILTNTARFFQPTTGSSGTAAVSATIAGPPLLTIIKEVYPGIDVPRYGPVTYTLSLVNNGPSPAEGVTLTDTLPIEVDFTDWVEQPAGAVISDGTLTWNGTVDPGEEIHFVFVATHNGDYGDSVSNIVTVTAAYGGSQQAEAVFSVTGQPKIYLPVITRTSQP